MPTDCLSASRSAHAASTSSRRTAAAGCSWRALRHRWVQPEEHEGVWAEGTLKDTLLLGG
jgi:hypothetical protein